MGIMVGDGGGVNHGGGCVVGYGSLVVSYGGGVVVIVVHQAVLRWHGVSTMPEETSLGHREGSADGYDLNIEGCGLRDDYVYSMFKKLKNCHFFLLDDARFLLETVW